MATATIKKFYGSKLAEKLRTLADGLQATIDDKRRPMTQNPTPKRQKEYMSRKLDGDNLERGQRALRALADAWERGDVPAVLQGLRSKADIVPLVRHGIDSSGYYDLRSTGKYADESPAGRALQALMDGAKSDVDKALDAERQRLAAIERMENELRFCDIPGFFPTPRPLIELMLTCADLAQHHTILEPSAGKGDIADAIWELHGTKPDCCEIVPRLRDILACKGHRLVGSDFTTFKGVLYDRIAMNPPFERGQDAEHVRHAYSLVAPGGRLVAVMSPGPFYHSDRKSLEFREWLERRDNVTTLDAPEGSFKGVQAFRQTGINCKILVVDRLPF